MCLPSYLIQVNEISLVDTYKYLKNLTGVQEKNFYTLVKSRISLSDVQEGCFYLPSFTYGSFFHVHHSISTILI